MISIFFYQELIRRINNNENFIEIYILLIYTIVNLTLIKVIYNWLHESHKTTNTSTNDLNDYAMFSILIL